MHHKVNLYNIEPITILWFVAIPLLDCIGLIFSRTINGKSWSTAGRDHIHHKLMKSIHQNTLIIILFITVITGAFGILLKYIYIIYFNIIVFCICFLYYFLQVIFGKKFLMEM